VGSSNVAAHYAAGLQSVRFEYEEGASGDIHSGWCDTSEAPWDWSTDSTTRYQCNRVGDFGSGHNLCVSGAFNVCDGSGWNNGWTQDISLGDADWDYAYQSAQNHKQNYGVDNYNVVGWQQTSHINNADGLDYQVRVWLRPPME
jgi:hypothetical protein